MMKYDVYIYIYIQENLFKVILMQSKLGNQLKIQ